MSRRDYSFIADTDSLEALRRLRRGSEGMCVPQHHAEMSEQVARKQSYDVQIGVRTGIGAKTRFSVTKCRFTQPVATLAFECGSARTSHLYRSHPCPAASSPS